MNFLERKLGRFAIPNIIRTILMGQAIVLFLMFVLNIDLRGLIWFDRSLILSGEIWRLFTFVLVPDTTDVLWFMLSVLIYSSIGSSLEQMLGTFKMNVYYFVSMFAVVIVAFFFNIRGGFPLTMYINTSLFLSFASLVPDATFLIYFIIPFKAKYLIILYVFMMASDVITNGWPMLVFLLASLSGYFLVVLFPTLKNRRLRVHGTAGQQAFRQAQRNGTAPNPSKPKPKTQPIKVAFHRCHVCGKTEVDDPEMDFRYCSKCNGHYEYCMDHIKDHTHVE